MIYTSGTTGKPKGALRTRPTRTIVFALLAELNLLHEQRGAPHDRAALPLRPARVRVAVRTPSAARSSCCASSTPPAGSQLVNEHRVTNTFSAPTQLKRIVSASRRRARARRHVVDAAASSPTPRRSRTR